MAVKPANSNYHTFTFNGVRAADYGIYVTDVNVFNSAARDVEYIEIPGRDGAFALDRGRFQNISVVYKCAMTQDTDEDFATAISEFRNAIASTKGYKRLEDDIHTDEYRMGVFSKGLEAPTLNTKTATFEVTFDCKPQRFLKSGEIPRTIGGAVTNPQTKSGAVVSIDSDGGDKVTSLVAQITPVQAGSGDPSPTNVRPITGWTAVNVIVSPTTTASDGTTTTTALGRTVYGGTLDAVSGMLTVDRGIVDLGTLYWSRVSTFGGSFWTTVNDMKESVANAMCSAYPTVNTGAEMTASNSAVYAKNNGYSVYVKDSRYTDATAFKAAMNGVQLCYELATPQTYNLTTQEVELLAGQNNVWADTGDISITYGHDPNKLVNPTLFESRPLLHLWGYGTVNMLADDQDSQIVINNDEYGAVLLTNKVTKSSSQVSEYFDKSATALLNSNDAVQVSAGSVLSISFDTAIGIVNVTNVSVSNTSTYDMSMTYSTTTHGMYFVINFSLEQIDFVYSQENQYKNSDVNVTVNYTQDGTAKTASFVVRIHAQSVYSRSRDNISVDLSASVKTSGAAFYINSSRPQSSTIQPIYGISTKRPFSDDADFYVDLDIGEAYREEDGQIINVNNAVTIPAKLPVLKSGANTITYDDTITQFQVIPNWWEV